MPVCRLQPPPLPLQRPLRSAHTHGPSLLAYENKRRRSKWPCSTRAAQVKQPLPIPSNMAQSYDIIKQALIELQLSVQDEIPKFQRHVVSDSTIAVAL